MIEVHDLHRHFGGFRAVDGASLQIRTGSITGLIGPNGAGKSTLFNVIAGVLPPTSGRVLMDGEDITGLPPHELFHKGLLRTFQMAHEFSSMSVRENLTLGRPEATDADIEQAIVDYAKKAKDGKIALEDLTGGTFSITNGGTFGSMMSTPIINPPQSAILGMHATKERAVVENGQVVVRPMMYLALSYDHRIIDGREAMLTLVAIKDALEDPARLLLDL